VDLPREHGDGGGGARSGVRFSNALPASARVGVRAGVGAEGISMPARTSAPGGAGNGSRITFTNALPRFR